MHSTKALPIIQELQIYNNMATTILLGGSCKSFYIIWIGGLNPQTIIFHIYSLWNDPAWPNPEIPWNLLKWLRLTLETPTWHALFAPHVPSPEAMTNLKQELQSDMTSQAQSTSTVFILCFSLLSGLCSQCSQPKVPASVPPTNPNRFFECFTQTAKIHKPKHTTWDTFS